MLLGHYKQNMNATNYVSKSDPNYCSIWSSCLKCKAFNFIYLKLKYFEQNHFSNLLPANIYLFKANYRNTKKSCWNMFKSWQERHQNVSFWSMRHQAVIKYFDGRDSWRLGTNCVPYAKKMKLRRFAT